MSNSHSSRHFSNFELLQPQNLHILLLRKFCERIFCLRRAEYSILYQSIRWKFQGNSTGMMELVYFVTRKKVFKMKGVNVHFLGK